MGAPVDQAISAWPGQCHGATSPRIVYSYRGAPVHQILPVGPNPHRGRIENRDGRFTMADPVRPADESRSDRGWWRWLRAIAVLSVLATLWLRLKPRQTADTRPRWSPLLPLTNLIDWRGGWAPPPGPHGVGHVGG